MSSFVTEVLVSPNRQTIVQSSAPVRVTVFETAMVGPRGLPGNSASTFDFTQSSVSDTWIINHNLGFRPAVQLFTTGGIEMMGQIQHISNNQVIATFAMPVAGTARLV